MGYGNRKGINEVALPADIDPGVVVITGIPNRQIVVERYRGVCSSAWEIQHSNADGSNPLTIEYVPAGAQDVPGIAKKLPVGKSLRVVGTGVTDLNAFIGYSYDQAFI